MFRRWETRCWGGGNPAGRRAAGDAAAARSAGAGQGDGITWSKPPKDGRSQQICAIREFLERLARTIRGVWTGCGSGRGSAGTAAVDSSQYVQFCAEIREFTRHFGSIQVSYSSSGFSQWGCAVYGIAVKDSGKAEHHEINGESQRESAWTVWVAGGV